MTAAWRVVWAIALGTWALGCTGTERIASDDSGLGPEFVTDSDGDDAPPSDVLSNIPNTCSRVSTVYPSAGEEGHWAAARLTTEVTFAVSAVGYSISTEAGCSVPDHRVAIFADDGGPAASPMILAEVSVASVAAEDLSDGLVVALTDPVRVEAGASIYVMVEMAVDDDGVPLCLLMCQDTNQVADANLWSNAVDAPYDWQDLGDFGVEGNLAVVGYRVAK